MEIIGELNKKLFLHYRYYYYKSYPNLHMSFMSLPHYYYKTNML